MTKIKSGILKKFNIFILVLSRNANYYFNNIGIIKLVESFGYKDLIKLFKKWVWTS